MKIGRIMVAGLAAGFLLTGLFFFGACSRGQTRVDASGVTTGRPAESKSPEGDREAEARRRAEEEAAQRAEAERRARLAPTERADQRLSDEARAFEAEPVYFEFDSSDIRSEYRPLLEKKAAWLKANPDSRVRIEGHCDDRGTAEYNLALGEKRAMKVMEYLASLGIPTKRMSTISYGEERPAVPGQTETAWEKNRRVEFRLQ